MPSTTEKISAIREEVCRVNPEIMELKFGCEVYVPDMVEQHRVRRIGSDVMHFSDGDVALLDQGSYVGVEAERFSFREKSYFSFEQEQKDHGTETALHNIIWTIAAEILKDLGIKKS